MRGKVQCMITLKTDFRITPAYAGKSCECSAHDHHRADHPRLCGEKGGEVLWQMIGVGSPPPMRGKADNLALQPHDVGITPAYAGKSGLHDVLPVPAKDHPRLCGEK